MGMLAKVATATDESRMALRRLYISYRMQQRTVNWFLFGIICILALVLAGRSIVTTHISKNVEELAMITQLVRDVASVVAIGVAGLWTYYVFVKGRTFEPRVKLHITLREVSSNHGAAIVHFALINIGQIKLSSLRGQARYYIGEGTPQGVIFIPMYLDEDLLRTYREAGESLILEPGDEINIDIPVIIKDFSKALLMIKSVFEVNERRSYKENAIFCLDNAGENP